MNRPRLVAALVVVVALVSLVALALQLEDAPRKVSFSAEIPSTTTSEPDFAALVQSGVISTLPPEEQKLTEEALSRATSTTTTVPTTTTTLPPSTTTTAAAQASTSPPATSAPTTSPPATSPPTTAAQGGFVGSAESDFASRINSIRSSAGLGGLQRNGSLDSYARDWARSMGQNGSLSHSNIGSLLGPWSAAGENVGVGGSVSVIFDALVGSSGHYDNMVGDWTHMGVGVWRDAQGALWTCHVFAR
ncbi:MAG TPA: CAP domain-containing protein [Acidimicrobiia bacterium]|nr:CAP domain-containing protein [Acidimicrobiia bacterium]